ncbi:hypothetical protein PGB27_22940 [Actinomycetospora sp. DW7H6]|uniref:Uncharacterized protein n=1 Tax=Actinomycetospora lemnae TaxID=3019891 RepID=A0ABT5SZQ9_9PSEU|nr:hypothetical protein [Actinomycetospora sp. DW7H6]MDD7968211.1 hypothetical protein [Actinomycetospora sp. DW7H6]
MRAASTASWVSAWRQRSPPSVTGTSRRTSTARRSAPADRRPRRPRGQHAGEDRAERHEARVVGERRVRDAGQRLGERAVRPAAGHGVPAQHPRARRRDPDGDLVEQPGLAAARLAGDQRHPSRTGQRRPDQGRDLVVPPGQRRRARPGLHRPSVGNRAHGREDQ